ncbi:hypothetical protein lbkm_2835 [Lachnospiraceae bacterium KM106-2]|nr:hypothetical protein lbkm_2835 [Lachnospiraceae bacterium KM106-2]
MINNRKVRIMTKLAIIENKEGKEVIKASQYFKRDYVRLQVLRGVISITLGYLLILTLIGLYQSEYLIAEAVTLNYKMIGTYVIGIYAMLIIIFVFAGTIGYGMKYDSSRKKLQKYNRGLKILSKMYEEE